MFISYTELIGYIIIFFIVIGIGGYLMLDNYAKIDKYCDNLYGKDNWELKEVTGEGDYKFYIGQVWECVNKTSGWS